MNLSEEARKKKSEALRGQVFTEERRQKISESKLGERNPMWGRKFTDEHRRKLSNSKRGNKHPMFGKKHTTETRQKQAKMKLGKKYSRETVEKRAKYLRKICTDGITVYDSLTDLARAYSIPKVTCHRWLKSTAHPDWKFL